MYHIDAIEKTENECIVRGWFFDSNQVVRKCFFDEYGKRTILDGYGLPSPDLKAIHGRKASHSRFEFRLPGNSPKGYIALKHRKGRSTIIPLSKQDVGKCRIKVRTHHFVNRRYFGRFEVIGGGKVKKVILSMGTSKDFRAVSVSRRHFYHEPHSNIFLLHTDIKRGWSLDELNIFFVFDDKTIESVEDVGNSARNTNPAYLMVRDFFSWMNALKNSMTIVEIGSRVRSGNNSRARISEHHHYIGTDLISGDNVDVVADAHLLSEHIKHNSVDAVFGISVFEHLAMPWKVAIELNRILRVGGRALFLTHQSWPLHDYPFDFWRYSEESWHAIFNAKSGFKVLDATVGEEGRILPEIQTADTLFGLDSIGFLTSSVLVEKTGETDLSWDVPPEDVYQGKYPSGDKVGLRGSEFL